MSKTIVCFGDSITYGEGVDTPYKWTTLLSDKLNEKEPLFNVINSGISGNTSYMGLNRVVEDLQVHRPDLITLQFGLNDCNYWETDEGIPRTQPETFVACLKEIVLRAKKFGARHVILSTNHPTLRFAKMPNGMEYEANNSSVTSFL